MKDTDRGNPSKDMDAARFALRAAGGYEAFYTPRLEAMQAEAEGEDGDGGN